MKCFCCGSRRSIVTMMLSTIILIVLSMTSQTTNSGVMLAYAQRNSASEAVCAPFLTMPGTTPLNPHNERNATTDENSEYECELVLQDTQLPLQIRATIHEGLAYLAMRHITLGLRRHEDALRHLDMLVTIMPERHIFAFKAGAIALDPYVADPHRAVDYLQRAVNGPAAPTPGSEGGEDDQPSATDVYLARRYLITALLQTHQHHEALAEVCASLRMYPVDFGAMFLFRELARKLDLEMQLGLLPSHLCSSSPNACNSSGSIGAAAIPRQCAPGLIAPALRAYTMIARRAKGNYTQIKPKPTVQKQCSAGDAGDAGADGAGSSEPGFVARFDAAHPPDAAAFNWHVRNRVPLTVGSAAATTTGSSSSNGNSNSDEVPQQGHPWWPALPSLIAHMGNCSYLLRHADDTTEVQVEALERFKQRPHSKPDMGFSLAVTHHMVSFKDYLEGTFCRHSSSSVAGSKKQTRARRHLGQKEVLPDEFDYYLNLQMREPDYFNITKSDGNSLPVLSYLDQQPIHVQRWVERTRVRKQTRLTRLLEALQEQEQQREERSSSGSDSDSAASTPDYAATAAELMESIRRDDEEDGGRGRVEEELLPLADRSRRLYNAPLHLYMRDVLAPPAWLTHYHNISRTGDYSGASAIATGGGGGGDEDSYDIWSNLQSVSMWMGGGESHNGTSSSGGASASMSEPEPATTRSRLHTDSHDNLYVLLAGTKTFLLTPPDALLSGGRDDHGDGAASDDDYDDNLAYLTTRTLQTLFPTYAVGSNGMSFRFSANMHLPWTSVVNSTSTTGIAAAVNFTGTMIHPTPPVLYPDDSKTHHFSSIPGELLRDYLRTNRIPFEEVTLSTPGDALYIPAGVSHQVTSYGDRHLALNYWWRPHGWETNSKQYEAMQLEAVRTELLDVLLPGTADIAPSS